MTLGSEECQRCKRSVLTGDPAELAGRGFIAKCGRRLRYLHDCSAGGCAPPARVVGRPGPGEVVCPKCDGAGQLEGQGPMHGCGICDATGVLDPLEALRKFVHDVDDLIANSEGVAGLHHNGDVAEWGSLTSEGAFGSWLGSLDVARAAVEGKPPAPPHDPGFRQFRDGLDITHY